MHILDILLHPSYSFLENTWFHKFIWFNALLNVSVDQTFLLCISIQQCFSAKVDGNSAVRVAFTISSGKFDNKTWDKNSLKSKQWKENTLQSTQITTVDNIPYRCSCNDSRINPLDGTFFRVPTWNPTKGVLDCLLIELISFTHIHAHL